MKFGWFFTQVTAGKIHFSNLELSMTLILNYYKTYNKIEWTWRLIRLERKVSSKTTPIADISNLGQQISQMDLGVRLSTLFTRVCQHLPDIKHTLPLLHKNIKIYYFFIPSVWCCKLCRENDKLKLVNVKQTAAKSWFRKLFMIAGRPKIFAYFPPQQRL